MKIKRTRSILSVMTAFLMVFLFGCGNSRSVDEEKTTLPDSYSIPESTTYSIPESTTEIHRESLPETETGYSEIRSASDLINVYCVFSHIDELPVDYHVRFSKEDSDFSDEVIINPRGHSEYLNAQLEKGRYIIDGRRANDYSQDEENNIEAEFKEGNYILNVDCESGKMDLLRGTPEFDENAPVFQSLRINTVYNFDLDGDGVEDTLTCTTGDSEEGEGYFVINGQEYPVFIARGFRNICYYSYSKKDTYLIYSYGQFGGNTTSACRFTGDKLEEIMDFNVLDRNLVLSPKGKELYIETSHYHPNHFMGIDEVTPDVPDIRFEAVYLLDTDKHTFVLKSGICEPVGDYVLTYTGKDYPLSDSYEEIDKDGFTLSKGDKVTLTHMYYAPPASDEDSPQFRYELTRGDQTGWYEKSGEDNTGFEY